jgi:hypothetical protein
MPILDCIKDMINQERLIDAAFEIEQIRAEDPNAICPTPSQLVSAEDAGLIWNFETGQADEPNPDADARQIQHIADNTATGYTQTVRYRGQNVPIIGTLNAKGIGIYTID